MSTDASTLAGLLLGIGGVVALYGLRRGVLGSGQQRPWIAVAALDVRNVAGLAGVVVGVSLPPGLRSSLEDLILLAIAFFAGWVGLSAGCGMDLRVLRRHPWPALAAELGQAAGVLVLMWVAVYLAVRSALVPEAFFSAPIVFMACALVVAGPSRVIGVLSRSSSGNKRGFWSPSLAALLAILFAALGRGQQPPEVFTLGAWGGAALPDTASFEGWGMQLLAGVLLGALIGLLCDLVTKRDFATTGLLYLIAGVVLVGSGVGAAMGLEPLLVGGVAGVWLINATLRRLDILHVLERANSLTKFALPFAVGWLLGNGLPAHGLDVQMLVFVLAVVLGFRPLVRVASAGLTASLATTQRRGGSRYQHDAKELVEQEDLALVVGVALYGFLPTESGLAALAAVLCGQLTLGIAGAWLALRQATEAG